MAGHNFSNFEERTPVPRLVSLANGITIGIGPGSGNQLPRFNTEKVTRVYGVEPNTYFVEVLKTKIEDCPNLAQVYVPISAALEDKAMLASHGIIDGSIDTVVCMQVLCSVPNPTAAATRIYRLLKPGW